MRCLLIGDLHIREFYRVPKVDRLADYDLLLGKLLDIIDCHQPNYVIQLGDFFHSLSPYFHKRTVNYGMDFISKIARRVEAVYILMGNHDVYRGECVITFLNRPNIRVIDKPIALGSFYFLPYGFEESRPPQNDMIVFFHDEIEGAVYPNGVVSKGRLSIPCKVAFGGHIHKPQVIHDRIHYIGVPIQHDFGETSIRPQVVLLDGDNLHVIPIDGLPSFHIVDVSSVDDLPQVNPSDYYLLRIKDRGVVSLLNDYMEYPRVFIEYDYVMDISTVRAHMDEILLDIRKLITSFCDELPISDDVIKEKVKKYSLEVWDAVSD